MEKFLSITELARLTGKTRPTIYKYLRCYNEQQLDNIPYSFIKLFELCKNINTTKKDVTEYCNNMFKENLNNTELEDFVKFVESNQEKINFKKLKEHILEEMHNGKNSN